MTVGFPIQSPSSMENIQITDGKLNYVIYVIDPRKHEYENKSRLENVINTKHTSHPPTRECQALPQETWEY